MCFRALQWVFAAVIMSFALPVPGEIGDGLIISGDVPLEPDYVDFVNLSVNADVFYNAGYFGSNTVIANVEAGHVWGGHEVFDRSGLGLPPVPSVMINASSDPTDAPQLGELDFHATMVGHVLAGTGHVGDGWLSAIGIGMAPLADLWSGAIATEFSTEVIGAFSFTTESFLFPYVNFFTGTEHGRPDVINSSWGFSGAGDSYYTGVIDALAATNPTVVSVLAAGNAGPGAGTVGEPAAGHNSIVVGALQAAQLEGDNSEPTDFSSRGPANFYNPVTDQIIEGVRAAVHIAAPGENMALAAYLGNTGSLTGHEVAVEDPVDDLYFSYNMSGTSFSAPVVAGGVALLRDVAKDEVFLAHQPDALDARVLRSVIMAGAVATPGWDNGQKVVDGVVFTDQSLDYATGAGSLDFARSLEVYVGGTTNLPGVNGGMVSSVGWDYGTVGLGMANDYIFDFVFEPLTKLTISLNWWVNGDIDTDSGELDSNAFSFADLNLEIWSMQDGELADLVAASASLYNNSEFLRIIFEAGGEFGFRVAFDQIVYDASGIFSQEDYAVAWMTIIVPEPSTLWLVAALFCLCLMGYRPRLQTIG